MHGWNEWLACSAHSAMHTCSSTAVLLQALATQIVYMIASATIKMAGMNGWHGLLSNAHAARTAVVQRTQQIVYMITVQPQQDVQLD
jgi:hypothetical protein